MKLLIGGKQRKIFTGLHGGNYYKKQGRKIYIKQIGGYQYNVVLLNIRMNRGEKKNSTINCECILTLLDDKIIITPPTSNVCKLSTSEYGNGDIIEIEHDVLKSFTENTFRNLNKNIIMISHKGITYNIKFNTFDDTLNFIEKVNDKIDL